MLDPGYWMLAILSVGVLLVVRFTLQRFNALTLQRFQNLLRGIMSWNTADRAATLCARAAEENVLPFRFNAPRAGFLFFGCKWPRRRILEDVAVIHA